MPCLLSEALRLVCLSVCLAGNAATWVWKQKSQTATRDEAGGRVEDGDVAGRAMLLPCGRQKKKVCRKAADLHTKVI